MGTDDSLTSIPGANPAIRTDYRSQLFVNYAREQPLTSRNPSRSRCWHVRRAFGHSAPDCLCTHEKTRSRLMIPWITLLAVVKKVFEWLGPWNGFWCVKSKSEVAVSIHFASSSFASCSPCCTSKIRKVFLHTDNMLYMKQSRPVSSSISRWSRNILR